MAKVNKINQITQTITKLRNEQALAILTGDYKTFKKTSQEYAKVAIDNFELTTKVEGPSINNIPLFSKTGLKMFKVWFLNLFRKKTPEEIQLRKLAKRYTLSKKYLH